MKKVKVKKVVNEITDIEEIEKLSLTEKPSTGKFLSFARAADTKDAPVAETTSAVDQTPQVKETTVKDENKVVKVNDEDTKMPLDENMGNISLSEDLFAKILKIEDPSANKNQVTQTKEVAQTDSVKKEDTVPEVDEMSELKAALLASQEQVKELLSKQPAEAETKTEEAKETDGDNQADVIAKMQKDQEALINLLRTTVTGNTPSSVKEEAKPKQSIYKDTAIGNLFYGLGSKM